jgi:hypothetical protein
MKAKVTIKTAVGYAESVHKQIEPFLMGLRKPKGYTYEFNDDKSQIVWHLEDNERRILKIARNVNMYDVMVKGIMNHRLFRKVIDKKLEPNQKAELEDLLKNQTKITFQKFC